MKKFKVGLAGIAICGLLSACGTGEVKPIEETKVKAVATNLRILAAGISLNQFARTAHIENTGKEKTNLEYAKDWTSMPEETEKAFDYIKQLLNDIDIAINKDGKGTTFGVSHLLNGGNVNKLESFISHGS